MGKTILGLTSVLFTRMEGGGEDVFKCKPLPDTEYVADADVRVGDLVTDRQMGGTLNTRQLTAVTSPDQLVFGVVTKKIVPKPSYYVGTKTIAYHDTERCIVEIATSGRGNILTLE
jgi:hypothetical protein